MKNIKVFLLTTYLFMLIMVESSPSSDQQALMAFKNQIAEDPHGALKSWNSSIHFCNWQGITCDHQKQRATVLNLQSQSLVGSLSPHIGNLTFLDTLNLENNSFHGQIPHELGRLFRLRYLLLSNNSFGGEIPASISNCSNLVDIHFHSIGLTGNIPSQLGSLSKLVILQLRMNDLTGKIPASFGNMSSLQHLVINFNNLDGSFPDSLGRMPSLQYIRIGANKLSGTVPSSLWNLSSLIEFYVADNQLQGTLPPDIGLTLPNLQDFGIAGNNFSGQIPNSISNMSSLDYFYIAENNFVGPITTNLGALKLLKWVDFSGNHLGKANKNDLNFLTTLVNCSQLGVLSLNDNRFGGPLPDLIANLSTTLSTLGLRRNEIHGRIPIGIQNLVNLTELSMEQNHLEGTIPLSIGKLRKLERLNLYGNKLSGEIPSSIGDISELYELHLQENNLTGSIPLSLKSFHRLQRLDLSQNALNGTIPGDVLGSSTVLSHLNLSHNSFTGSLPFEVGNLINLEVLDVSENNLSGAIPSTLGECWKLEQLYMEGNTFDGNLSPLVKLKTVEHMDVSRNNLTGQVPKDFEDFPFLQSLNLSFNHLQGQLPVGGVFRNASVILIAGNDNLCGGIPEFKLPSCLAQTSKKHKISLTFNLMIPIVVVSLTSITTFLVLYWRRKHRKIRSLESAAGDWYYKVSYDELLKATNGFDQKNLIGVGGFGTVYKGFLPQEAVPVAIKVLKLQERGASKSFMAECEALKNVRHRNLLKILYACSTVDHKGDNFKALIYKFMTNGSLEDWLHPHVDDNQPRQKILSFGQRLNIAIDVALALDYLHHHCETPIAHCDVKPSNILLDDELTAHVGDFGLVKFLSTPPNNSQKDEASSFAIKGSIGYLAPEYGAGGKVSTNGDIYSYGILLLEMFTGKRPTDEMFKDALSLHSFSEMALPERVMEIADPRMFYQEEFDEGIEIQRITPSMMHEYLVSIFRIGVACSAESQGGRMDIKQVLIELSSIKKFYQQVGVHGQRHRSTR